jgi:cytochrome c6
MKFLKNGIAKILIINFILQSSVQAKSLNKGAIIFKANCNICHIGGNNIIIPEKNLFRRSLEANGMNNQESIEYQITNGKNGMPAFGGRLNEDEIKKVANYVFLQEFKEE